MATEFLREKINTLNSLIMSEALQIFQHEMLVEAATKSTGDKQVDQVIKSVAQNANTVILAGQRRLEVYRGHLVTLEIELDQTKDLPV